MQNIGENLRERASASWAISIFRRASERELNDFRFLASELMTKAMVHRLDLDEDGIAAARIVWTEDGNAFGCVANGTLRSSSAISSVEKSGNT